MKYLLKAVALLVPTMGAAQDIKRGMPYAVDEGFETALLVFFPLANAGIPGSRAQIKGDAHISKFALYFGEVK